MSTGWWLVAWCALTVLAGTGVVLNLPKHERHAGAQVFAAWTLASWAVLGVLKLIGWW